jgi:hypothetical protein
VGRGERLYPSPKHPSSLNCLLASSLNAFDLLIKKVVNKLLIHFCGNTALGLQNVVTNRITERHSRQI